MFKKSISYESRKMKPKIKLNENNKRVQRIIILPFLLSHVIFSMNTFSYAADPITTSDPTNLLSPVVAPDSTTSPSTSSTTQTETSTDWLSAGPLAAATTTAPSLAPTSSVSTADIISLPGNPGVAQVAPPGNTSTVSQTQRGVMLNYNTTVGGWTGGGFSFDNFSTSTIETQDLSKYSQLTFGLKGNPSQVKFEIVSMVNGTEQKASVYLTNILSSQEQVWLIPTSQLTGIDLTKVRSMYFIVEGDNQTGTLEINRTATSVNIVSSSNLTTANITSLGSLSITRVAPAGNTSTVSASSRGVVMNYNTSVGGWAGSGFSFDNFSTTAIETQNLNGYSQLIFGLKGNSSQVKMEVLDNQGRQAVVYLTGIRSDIEQIYAISATQLKGVDLTKGRLIYFIVEGTNQTGTLEVNRIPTSADLAKTIAPSSTLTQSDLTNLPGTAFGTIMRIASSTSTTSVSSGGPGILAINYSTGSTGWAGGAWSFDNFTTNTTIRDQNLSGLSNLVFGIKGQTSKVKLEVSDSQGRKAFVRLTGISSSTEQFYSISTSQLAGIDLAKVRTVAFIVEGLNLTGTLVVREAGSSAPTTLTEEFKRTMTDDGKYWVIFTRELAPDGFSQRSSASVIEISSLYSTGIFTGSASYLLGSPQYHQSSSLHYDPLTGQLQASGITPPLMIQGSSKSGFIMSPSYLSYTTSVLNNVTTVTITNTLTGYQFQYTTSKTYVLVNKVILTDSFGIIDWSNDTIDVIRNDWSRQGNLGVKATITGVRAADDIRIFANGYIEVKSDGTLYNYPNPSNSFYVVDKAGRLISQYTKPVTSAEINIPGNPKTGLLAPSGNTTTVTAISRGMAINYDLKGDWAGGSFSYDDFSTPAIETQNLSGLSELVFGLKGTTAQVKVELVDANGKKWSVNLSGISSTEEKVWQIPARLIIGIDLTKIAAINFIIEGGTRTGTLEVYRIPPGV